MYFSSYVEKESSIFSKSSKSIFGASRSNEKKLFCTPANLGTFFISLFSFGYFCYVSDFSSFYSFFDAELFEGFFNDSLSFSSSLYSKSLNSNLST